VFLCNNCVWFFWVNCATIVCVLAQQLCVRVLLIKGVCVCVFMQQLHACVSGELRNSWVWVFWTLFLICRVYVCEFCLLKVRRCVFCTTIECGRFQCVYMRFSATIVCVCVWLVKSVRVWFCATIACGCFWCASIVYVCVLVQQLLVDVFG